jgi:hypothetical protein
MNWAFKIHCKDKSFDFNLELEIVEDQNKNVFVKLVEILK